MYELFDFSALYSLVWVVFALVVLAAVVSLIVFLIAAAKAASALARYRHVQTELLLSEAVRD
ncbi:hypothetical protein [Agromyces sp. NPDC058064]|uniref:hypothetical protein n=1 Tax=Agromyces sp. NPDC058064 TaxID=3346322 RepID=UPI0036D7CF28